MRKIKGVVIFLFITLIPYSATAGKNKEIRKIENSLSSLSKEVKKMVKLETKDRNVGKFRIAEGKEQDNPELKSLLQLDEVLDKAKETVKKLRRDSDDSDLNTAVELIDDVIFNEYFEHTLTPRSRESFECQVKEFYESVVGPTSPRPIEKALDCSHEDFSTASTLVE
jgi:hypothetical protein